MRTKIGGVRCTSVLTISMTVRDTTNLISLIINGEIIEDYPDDFAYPSALILGYMSGTAFHVVVAKCKNLVEWLRSMGQMRKYGSIIGHERCR